MKGFEVIQGKSPILISAPHVFPHYRPGFELRPKVRELFTKEFAIELAKQLDCFCIISTTIQKLDPSWYKESPYRKCVGEVIKENNIELFIDIHGKQLQGKKMFEVWVNENDRNAVELIRNWKHYLSDDMELEKKAFINNNQCTLAEYVYSEHKIPSLQLELSLELRQNSDIVIHSIKKLLVSIEN